MGDSSESVMICPFFYVFIIWFLSFESVTGSQYRMGFLPPEDLDVSLEPGGVARLTAEDLGTFWSRRKKSGANQDHHRPFSSFWSRRKKSRAKLPSLPFSTIIRARERFTGAREAGRSELQ